MNIYFHVPLHLRSVEGADKIHDNFHRVGNVAYLMGHARRHHDNVSNSLHNPHRFYVIISFQACEVALVDVGHPLLDRILVCVGLVLQVACRIKYTYLTYLQVA